VAFTVTSKGRAIVSIRLTLVSRGGIEPPLALYGTNEEYVSQPPPLFKGVSTVTQSKELKEDGVEPHHIRNGN